jgi:molecular chaperone DnaK
MKRIIGIDLGTTNSVAAIVEAGVPRVLENREGSRLTPSVVAISKSGERLVGILAKRQAITNPKNTIFSVKRLIGRRYIDPEVQKAKNILPYEIREAENGGVEVKMGDRWYKPEEISAMVLQKIKLDVEEKLGEKIDEAVITCPAYFDDSQRAATKAAGEIAGFNVRRLLPEPTAAALAYGLDKKTNAKILVYDFGGGTFDVSILEVGDNIIETKGIGGDTFLGGDDFDNRIIDFLIEWFKKEEGVDLREDVLALQRLKEAAEKAKQELSSLYETEINLPFITSTPSGPKHLYYKLTRKQLEDLTRDLVELSIEKVKETLDKAGVKKEEIDEIILVGGQTRMPLIQQRVREFFGKEPRKDINPDEVVAIGAAIQAGILQGEIREILLIDVVPLTLAIETLGGIAHPMIPKNTPIPVTKKEIFTTAADNQTQVEIHVVQGERPMAQDNKTLARFILDGIPPAPRGVPQIEVTFDVDINGILTVTAVDKATGRSQSVKITNSVNLSKEEIERLKKEAEEYAAQDMMKRKLAETKNQANNLVYQAEKILKEYQDKIDPDLKTKIEEKINKLNGLIETSNSVEEIEREMKELNELLSEIGRRFYGSQTQSNR